MSPARSRSPHTDPIPASAGAPLSSLVHALGTTVATVETAPGGADVTVHSVALLEGVDLRTGGSGAASEGPAVAGDLCLLVGVTAERAGAWLASAEPASRPVAVASKDTSPSLVAAAERAGVALVTIHAQARVDLVLTTVGSLLHGATRSSPEGGDGDRLGGEDDLYGLAQTVAGLTGGLVSIEDDRSQLLAYSATDGAADELRMLSILGREGPAEYLRRLRDWGVYDRLRSEPGVVEVPADEELGWRRRLAVDIRSLASDVRPSVGDVRPSGGGPRSLPEAGLRPQPGPRTPAPSLGTIWLQEGARPLDPDAGAVLEGSAAVAARLIDRARRAPTQEALQIQRLLGLRGGGVDVPSLAAALSVPATGRAAVIGIAPRDAAERRSTSSPAVDEVGASTPSWPSSPSIGEIAAAVRLHASAFARESLATTTESRIYVLVPRLRGAGLARWTGTMLERITRRTGVDLRAAVASPVPSLADVAAARAEVDRVLDRPGTQHVTTLAESRTAVLLGEITDLVAERDELRDPRLQALVDDDLARHGSLVVSLEEYLDRFGDVRSSAAALHVHPNTLRYRIRRAERVLGMRLDNPEDRLLLQLQLRRWRRHGP